MIIDTTHHNKEHKKILENFVGKPYSLWDSLKRGGVGSKRMIVKQLSPNLNYIINIISDLNYANIELRKKGILIRINKGLKNFTWAIPFYQLVFYKTDFTSIHAQGRFIHFENSKTFKENKKFFENILAEKIKFDKRYILPQL
ncbi:MAG: hypothetical protein CMC86_07875 [Flavobacteriaceae bacterium]|nr:hypothetical protein [Flavobacteriaceae bacterium]